MKNLYCEDIQTDLLKQNQQRRAIGDSAAGEALAKEVKLTVKEPHHKTEIVSRFWISQDRIMTIQKEALKPKI